MSPSRARRFAAALLCCFALPATLHAQRGAITAPRNLVELTDAASTIVHGVVLSASFEPHPQFNRLKTVVVSVRVKEALKGSASGVYTFRQFIWDMRDQFNTAGYGKGQEVILLMNRPSKLGLSAPVGLEQGRFRIVRDRSGKALAMNGHGNAGLFGGMQAHLQQRKGSISSAASKMIQQNEGAVDVAELSQLIRQIAGKK